MRHVARFICVSVLAFAPVAAQARAELTANELIQVCQSPDEADQMRCLGYLRPVAERFSALKIHFNKACSTTSLKPGYLNRFRSYAQKMPPEENTIAAAYALNFWIDSGIPCEGSFRHVAVSHLQEFCNEDHDGASFCKFYMDSTISMARFESMASGTPFLCHKADETFISDEEVLGAYEGWIQRNPGLKRAPAVLGLIDVLVSTYPYGE